MKQVFALNPKKGHYATHKKTHTRTKPYKSCLHPTHNNSTYEISLLH